MRGSWSRVGVIVMLGLGSGLSGAELTPAAVVTEAQQVAELVREVDQRALALAEVAVAWQRLGEARWADNMQAAEQLAAQVDDPFKQAMVWRGLAVRGWELQPDQARQGARQAIEQARQVQLAGRRVVALGEIWGALAPLDGELARQSLSEALSVADSIEAPLLRAGALREIAATLSEREPELAGDLFRRAAGVLREVRPVDEALQLAQVELIAGWGRLNLAEAQNEIKELTGAELPTLARQRLCQALAPVNPEQALAVAGSLPPGPLRAQALLVIAAQLPHWQSETVRALISAASEMIGSLAADDAAWWQTEMVVASGAVDVEAALQVAGEIEDSGQREVAVGRLARRLGPVDLAQAWRVADSLPDCPARDRALAQLIPLQATVNPAAALEGARGLLGRRDQVRALLAIGGALAEREARPGGR